MKTLVIQDAGHPISLIALSNEIGLGELAAIGDVQGLPVLKPLRMVVGGRPTGNKASCCRYPISQ